jgi:hypothetical protein
MSKNKYSSTAKWLILASFIMLGAMILTIAPNIRELMPLSFAFLVLWLGLLLVGAILGFAGGIKSISDEARNPETKDIPPQTTKQDLIAYFLAGFLLSIIGVVLAVALESMKKRDPLKGTLAAIAGMLCWLAFAIPFLLPNMLK